jgi:hypothetical protein
MNSTPNRKKAPASLTKASPSQTSEPTPEPAAKSASKPTSKPASKEASKATSKNPGKLATKKPPKIRPRLVRDGFTMPEADFALIATLKARALAGKRAAKKSELLRAGLHALAALDSKTLLAALDQLEPVKIGRPSKAS